MHALARLATWADATGMPARPELWLRTETIDAFVLTGCPGRSPKSVLTYRSLLRRLRDALVRVQRGQAPAVRMSAPVVRDAPYEAEELAELRHWATHLAGRRRFDALALLALGAGCGLAPGEIAAARGTDFRVTGAGAVVFDRRSWARCTSAGLRGRHSWRNSSNGRATCRSSGPDARSPPRGT